MPFRGEKLSCVSCGAALVDARLGKVPVARCGRCAGTWMNEQELVTALRAKFDVEELVEHNDGTPRRPCPRCAARMDIVWFEFLRLDRCAAHGVWLDAGELERALAGDVVPPLPSPMVTRRREE